MSVRVCVCLCCAKVPARWQGLSRHLLLLFSGRNIRLLLLKLMFEWRQVFQNIHMYLNASESRFNFSANLFSAKKNFKFLNERFVFHSSVCFPVTYIYCVAFGICGQLQLFPAALVLAAVFSIGQNSFYRFFLQFLLPKNFQQLACFDVCMCACMSLL